MVIAHTSSSTIHIYTTVSIDLDSTAVALSALSHDEILTNGFLRFNRADVDCGIARVNRGTYARAIYWHGMAN